MFNVFFTCIIFFKFRLFRAFHREWYCWRHWKDFYFCKLIMYFPWLECSHQEYLTHIIIGELAPYGTIMLQTLSDKPCLTITWQLKPFYYIKFVIYFRLILKVYSTLSNIWCNQIFTTLKRERERERERNWVKKMAN